MKPIIQLVQRYQNNRDEQSFSEILEIFSPLIRSYARKLFYLEYEDSCQELAFALYEAVIKIPELSSPGKCFSYLAKSIQHRFHKLYRQSKLFQAESLQKCSTEVLEKAGYFETGFSDCLLYFDLNLLANNMPSQSRKLLRLLMEEYTDAEIGAILGCSKQYVNRLKKNILK